MRTVLALMNRNRKLFFKDKGMLLTSMITPVILIVLYATFLAKVFRDSFTAAIPDVITISDKLINGTVAAQLTASLMAVSCITVTFCVNLTMVQDKANGTRKDFDVSPISSGKIYLENKWKNRRFKCNANWSRKICTRKKNIYCAMDL